MLKKLGLFNINASRQGLYFKLYKELWNNWKSYIFDREIVQHTTSSCFTIAKKIYGSYIKVFCRIYFLTIMTFFLIFFFCRFNYRKASLQLPCQNSLWEKPEYPKKTHNFKDIRDTNLRCKMRFWIFIMTPISLSFFVLSFRQTKHKWLVNFNAFAACNEALCNRN